MSDVWGLSTNLAESTLLHRYPVKVSTLGRRTRLVAWNPGPPGGRCIPSFFRGANWGGMEVSASADWWLTYVGGREWEKAHWSVCGKISSGWNLGSTGPAYPASPRSLHSPHYGTHSSVPPPERAWAFSSISSGGPPLAPYPSLPLTHLTCSHRCSQLASTKLPTSRSAD